MELTHSLLTSGTAQLFRLSKQTERAQGHITKRQKQRGTDREGQTDTERDRQTERAQGHIRKRQTERDRQTERGQGHIRKRQTQRGIDRPREDKVTSGRDRHRER